MTGSILSYCSYRAPDGRRYKSGECPKPPRHRKWMFVVDLGRVHDPATGGWRRQQLKRGGFETRRDAERALRAEQARIDAGTAPSLAERALTTGEYLNGWLAAGVNRQGQPWRPVTATSYRTDVECYLIPGIGRHRLADLRAATPT